MLSIRSAVRPAVVNLVVLINAVYNFFPILMYPASQNFLGSKYVLYVNEA